MATVETANNITDLKDLLEHAPYWLNPDDRTEEGRAVSQSFPFGGKLFLWFFNLQQRKFCSYDFMRLENKLFKSSSVNFSSVSPLCGEKEVLRSDSSSSSNSCMRS